MARVAISGLLSVLLGITGLSLTALPASAAPVLSITPITWNVVGLDHNAPVTSGPDTFASGARVCNTGNATATNVTSNYIWDTANTYINTTGLTTLSVASLAAGACTDFYYNIVVTRTAAAFDTARRFHITATADGLGTVSTPTPREIYVEHLRSQNRNTIDSISGPSTVVVGNTYTYVLTSSTSSSFEQWSSFLNFPNFAFQIVSVGATYTLPPGATNSTIYADACGFQQDPTLANYRECVGPVNFTGGAVGGTAVTTYQVKILSAGAFGINALIYDKSGGSYHYNSDWGNGGESVTAVEQVDLSIAKSDSVDPVTAGNDLTYTLNVSNAGPSTAHNVAISDPLPAGTSFVSASDGGTNSSGTVSWSIGDLAPGGSVSRTVTVHVNASRTTAISNTATVSTTTTDTNAANDSVTQGTAVSTSADVSLTKTDAADPVAIGNDVSYTLTASNAGPSDAQNVQISDPLPAGLSYVSATPSQGSCSQAAGTVTCSLGVVAAGANATVTVVATSTADGSLTNTASVSSTTSDPASANNAASQGTTISPRADLSITKTDSADPVTAGEDLTYTLTATNNGPSTAQNVSITDAVPTGTSFVSASNGGTESAGTVTWSVGSLASGATASRTLVVHVNAGRTNPLSNTATVSTTTTDPTPGNDSATQGTTVATSADLSLTKTDDADPVGVGANVTYTLSVHNGGPSDATGVSVSDPLPTGVTYVSATPSQGTCSFATGTVSCALGTVAYAGNATVAVVVTADADGALTNTASVTATTSDPVPGNDGASQGTTVDPLVDVSVGVSDSADPVTAGTDLAYTLAVHNAGPSTAKDVSLSDPLPAGTSFVSASGGGSLAVGTVTWTLGDLASGATVTRTVVVHVDPDRTTPLSNTVHVATATTDTAAGNDDDTETTQVAASADLSLTKTDDADPVAVGSDLTYAIVVHNAGPSTATAVEVADVLPAGVTFASASSTQGSCGELAGTVTCTLGTMAPGADVTIDVTVSTTADGTLSNTATASSTTPDPSGGNDDDTESTDVTPVADLEVTKDDGVAAVVAGASTTYTITVTNHGPSAAPAGVQISDAIPADTSPSEAESDCDLSGAVLTCTTSAPIPVGGTVAWDLTLAVDAGHAGPDLSNTATIASSPYADDDGSNDADTDVDAVDTVADVGVSIDDDADPVDLGTAVTYTIEAHNDGPSDAVDVVVTSVLPAGLAFSSADAPCALVAGIVTCSIGTLAAGDTVSFDLVADTVAAGTVTVPVGVATSTDDPVGANDGDTESTDVTAIADLSIAKTDDADPVAVGTDLTYTIDVHNAGPASADDVEVEDVLPSGMTFVSASAPCSESSGTVTCALGTLAAGADASVAITVTPTVDGPVTNTATVSSSTVDRAGGNGSDAEATDVTPLADLEIAKDDGVASVVAGASTTYTITVTNHGPTTVPAGVEVTDAIPAHVTASETEGDCDLSAGVLTCTTTGAIPVNGSVSYDLDVTVDPDDPDPDLSNTAAIASSPYADDDGSNDAATDVDDVLTIADLGVAIDDSADPVVLGDAVSYTVTVTNAGPSEAQDVEAVVTLPAAIAFASADPGCSNVGGVVTCSIASLAAGGSASFEVDVDTVSPGTANVPVVVTGSTSDPNAANDTDTEATDITPSADLSIAKTDDADPVPLGTNVTYTLSVHNAGPGDADDVEIEDVLPAAVTFVSATTPCTENAGTVTCPLGTLAAGADESVQVTVAPVLAGGVTNKATVSSSTPDPVAADDSATETTTVTPVADLEITKDDGVATVVAGTTATYTLTLTNLGPSDVPPGVVLTDDVPADASAAVTDPDCSLGGGTITCTTSGWLAAGDSVAYDVDVTVEPDAAGPTFSNTVEIDPAPYADPDASNDAATDTDLLGSNADLSVSIGDDVDPVTLGGDVVYTVTVANAGSSDAQAVAVDVDLSGGLAFVGGAPGCTYAAGTVTCIVGTLPAGSPPVSFDVTASPLATGTVSVPAVVSSTTADADTANDTDAESTDVVAPPVTDADLEVTIDDAVDPVLGGSPITYTITITNHGPADAAGVQLDQTFPVGSSFVSATPAQGSCTSGATLVCAVGALASGATTTVTVVVDAPGSAGQASSDVTVSAVSPDPVGANDTAGETTDVVVNPSTDLSIAKDDGTTSVTAGGWTTYTLTVHNAGPDDVPAGVMVTDDVPPGTALIEGEADCDVAGGTMTCITSTPLAAGADLTYAVDMTVPADFSGATITNAATIAGSPIADPDNANDTASDVDDVLTRADLSVAIGDTPDPTVLGGDVTYTISVTNAGPSDAAAAGVTAPLPPNATYVSGDAACGVALGNVLCAAGTLAAGASRSFQVVLHPTTVGTVTVDATASSSTFDPDLSDNDASEDTTVVAAPPTDVDVAVSISDTPDPVTESGTLTYDLTIDNGGPATAANVAVAEQLPAGTAFVSASAGCAHAAGVVTCSVGALTSGAVANRSVVVTAPSALAALSATATVTTTGVDTDASNDTDVEPTAMQPAVVPPGSADLGVTISDAPDPVDAGDGLTYTIGVTNAGPDDATTTVVSLPLPAGVTFVSASVAGGTCANAAGVVTCQLGTVPSGGSATITVVVDTTIDGSLSATATVSSAVADPNPANDAATTVTTVGPVADLALAKDDAAMSVVPGTTTTYTLTLSNAGPSIAPPGVVVTDQIPAGTTAHVTDPACALAGPVVTCTTTAPVAAGANVTFAITLDVPAGYAQATLANTASVTASPITDPGAANDSATDTDQVVATQADLSIFKQDVPDPVAAGERITYTISVTNDGPGIAQDVVVSDPLPPSTSIEEIRDGGTEANGIVTWNVGTLAVGETAVVELVVLLDVNYDGDVSNTAMVAASTDDPDPSDDSATAVTSDDPAGADLSLTKEADSASAAVGDTITYTIVVANAGPADATGVEIEDVLPTGLGFVSAHADRGSYDEDAGIWSIGDLANGDDATLELKVRVTGAAASSVTNHATVAGLDQTDDTPANDEDEAAIEVLGSTVEVVAPETDGELAYTGFASGQAARIFLLLLLAGIVLLVAGRRLERGTD